MTDPDLGSLGGRLKFAREARRLKARELGRLAGLSESHPSLIESGARAHVSAETLSKLATALGVSLEWLLDGGTVPDALVDPYAPPASSTTEKGAA